LCSASRLWRDCGCGHAARKLDKGFPARGMRRSIRCVARTPSSAPVRSSQLPVFRDGVPRAALNPCRQPFERRKHHEQVGRTVALVRVTEPRWSPFLRRHRVRVALGQLLDRFVRGRPDRAASMVATKAPLASGRSFNTGAIVLSPARPTISGSTNLLLHPRAPSRGSEQANAISLASRWLLAVQNRLKSLFHQLLAVRQTGVRYPAQRSRCSLHLCHLQSRRL
jgi:hypothetical protein